MSAQTWSPSVVGTSPALPTVFRQERRAPALPTRRAVAGPATKSLRTFQPCDIDHVWGILAGDFNGA
jgi:hypothetical protein